MISSSCVAFHDLMLHSVISLSCLAFSVFIFHAFSDLMSIPCIRWSYLNALHSVTSVSCSAVRVLIFMLCIQCSRVLSTFVPCSPCSRDHVLRLVFLCPCFVQLVISCAYLFMSGSLVFSCSRHALSVLMFTPCT